MGRKQNFTADRVAGFKCNSGKQQTIFWDGKAPGLGFRVTASGARSYIFETRLHGKTLRVTIGDERTYSIGKAQKEATRLKALTDRQVDPRQEAADKATQDSARRIKEKAGITLVSVAWDAYLAHQADKMKHQHIERGKRWGARHMADHKRLAQAGGEKKKRGSGETVRGVLYPLLQMRMTEITAEALRDWQRREAETRANNARQGFEMFRAFWRWCATRPEYAIAIDAQAVESKEVRDEVPSRKNKRFDVLERAHLPKWFEAVRKIRNPVVSTYLQALLLTGARREEMAELKWVDVDVRWNNLWLKDKVAPEGRKVPLTPYLRHLIDALPRRKYADGKANPWVFSSPGAANGRIVEPRLPHNRALSSTEVPPLTLHGLRRTFASLAEWTEMPVGVIAQIMGHKPSATAERHYIARPLDLLALWHTKYEKWILEQAGIDFQPAEPGLRLVSAA